MGWRKGRVLDAAEISFMWSSNKKACKNYKVIPEESLTAQWGLDP